MKRTCSAEGCTVTVRPQLFACARHWRMVPLELQRELQGAYQHGQEQDRSLVSAAYLVAHVRCRIAIAQAEGRDLARLERQLSTFERLAELRAKQAAP